MTAMSRTSAGDVELPGQLDILDLLPARVPAAVESLAGEATWVVVACGGEKLTYPAPAGELYVGSYHRSARRAAAALVPPERTLILSGLHGLLQLETQVAPYEARIDGPDGVAARTVARQMRDYGIARPRTRVVVLAGRAYAIRMREAMCQLHDPARPDLEPIHRGSIALDLPLWDTRGIGDQMAIFTRIAKGGAA